MINGKKIIENLIKLDLILLKYMILIPLKVSHFLCETKGGTGILIFMILGMYGLPYPFSTIIFFFLSDIISVLIFCTISAQFSISRELLKKLIGVENFSKYVGDNPGSITGKHLFKVGLYCLGIGVGKVGLNVFQDQANSIAANTYAEDCRRQNLPIDEEKFHKFYERRFSAIYQNIFKPTKK